MIDLEAAMSRVLRAAPAITDLVDDRVWLTMPREPTFPAVLIVRIAGAPNPTWQQRIVHDDGEFDLHFYGGSRVEALNLAQTALDVLCTARDHVGISPYNVIHVPDAELPQSEGRDRERYIISLRAFSTRQEAS